MRRGRALAAAWVVVTVVILGMQSPVARASVICETSYGFGNFYASVQTSIGTAFTMGSSSWELESVTARMTTHNGATMRVGIYGDTGGQPGATAVWSTQTYITNNTYQSFSFPADGLLSAGNTYWLVYSNVGSSGDETKYAFVPSGTSIADNTGAQPTQQWRFSLSTDPGNWAWYAGSGTDMVYFQLQGTIVPEPGSLALLALGALSLLRGRR